MSGNNHFISAKNESPKMFDNKYLDKLSRAPYFVVPIIFVPIILYFIYSAFVVHQVGILLFAGLFAAGILVWTLFEYFLHRYLFHLEINTDWGKRMHFMIHGCHHDYPNDALRLVIPPTASLTLAVLMYGLFYIIIIPLGGTTGMLHAFYASFVIGYVIYDMMHYASHYAKFKSQWFRDIQKNHMDHHFVDHDKGFGLSNVFWDRVFGTEQDSIKHKK